MAPQHKPNRLKELLDDRDMSMEDLAAKAHTTKATISRLATGKMQMTTTWAERLAPHLRCHPAELFGSDPLTDDEVRLVMRYRGLSEERRNTFERLLDVVEHDKAR